MLLVIFASTCSAASGPPPRRTPDVEAALNHLLALCLPRFLGLLMFVVTTMLPGTGPKVPSGRDSVPAPARALQHGCWTRPGCSCWSVLCRSLSAVGRESKDGGDRGGSMMWSATAGDVEGASVVTMWCADDKKTYHGGTNFYFEVAQNGQYTDTGGHWCFKASWCSLKTNKYPKPFVFAHRASERSCRPH